VLAAKLTAVELIAFEAVILREDGLLRTLGIESGCEQCFESGCEQCFESLDFLCEFLVLFLELFYDFGQLNNDVRLLRDFQIPCIDFCCGGG
jgi:hypothetical protein